MQMNYVLVLEGPLHDDKSTQAFVAFASQYFT